MATLLISMTPNDRVERPATTAVPPAGNTSVGPVPRRASYFRGAGIADEW